jgi:hypothetical protein
MKIKKPAVWILPVMIPPSAVEEAEFYDLVRSGKCTVKNA